MTTTEINPGDSLEERIAARLAGLSRAERKVAEYMRNHLQEVVFASADEIGAAAGTSDATVVRTAKALGYSGLIELKYVVGQQVMNQQVMNGAKPITRLRNRIEEVGPDTSSLVEQLFLEAHERLVETERRLTETNLEQALDVLDHAAHILCFGLGPSESNAEYMALRLTRLGRQARATGATGFALADHLLNLGESDTVVILTPGRMLNEHEVIVDHAQQVGARTLLITDSLGPLLEDRVDVMVRAVHSPSGFTGETLCGTLVVDVLILGLAARDRAAVEARWDQLTALRSRLIDADSRDYVSRARRRQL
jgi:DNA-binding MurR/RpiR family transcriptional regulator